MIDKHGFDKEHYYCLLAKMLVVGNYHKAHGNASQLFPTIEGYCDQTRYLQEAAQFPMATRRHAVFAVLQCTDECVDGPAVVHALLDVQGVQCGHHYRLQQVQLEV